MSSTNLLPIVSGDFESALALNKENNWPDLDPKVKLFALEYSIAGNFTNACKKGGIGRDVGARLLKDRLVRAFIDDLLEDTRQESIITKDFMELQMLETLEQVNGDVDVPMVTREGDAVMARNFNPSAKIALLKEMRTFAGVREGGGSGGVSINFDFRAFGVADSEDQEKSVGVTIEHGGD